MKKIILSLVAFVSLVFADTDYNFATELEKNAQVSAQQMNAMVLD